MNYLGTLGGAYSYATAINSAGLIIGGSALAGDSTTHAFLYDGVMKDLDPSGAGNSSADQINAAGQVVGSWEKCAYTDGFFYNGAMHDLTLGVNRSYVSQLNGAGQVAGTAYLDDVTFHAFRYDGASQGSNGVMVDLGTHGGSNSSAEQINRSGQVAGESYLDGDITQVAFLDYGGTMHNLGNLGGTYISVTQLNDAGQVVGNATTAGDLEGHAFLFDGHIGDPLVDLGTLGGNQSSASQINAAGQVIGDSSIDASGLRHAFFWDGQMHGLALNPADDSTAVQINAAGQVIGQEYNANQIDRNPFLYAGGTVVDLNSLLPADSGWTLSQATLINDRGQIFGYGTHNSQYGAAFLLTPPPTVVDPSTITSQLAAAIAYTQRSSSATLSYVAPTTVQMTSLVSTINSQPAPVLPITIKVDLGGQIVSGQTLSPPNGMTVKFFNGTFDPDMPALTVTSGQVVASGCTFTTSGDAPTILVTGGTLTLRDDLIQESDHFARTAIEVSGGTVDLGTAASPGHNTLEVRGTGEWVLNTTTTPIAADDSNTFLANGLDIDQYLQGAVWVDFNNDGAVDFGEQGIDGVAITLTGKDDLGNSVLLTSQTAGGGIYTFGPIRPGTYRITECSITARPRGGRWHWISSALSTPGDPSAMTSFKTATCAGK